MTTRVWTDASFSYREKVGGYGILIQHEGKFRRFWGMFPEKVETCSEAERLAIAKALNLTQELGSTIVELFTDSLTTVKLIEQPEKFKGRVGAKAVRLAKLRLKSLNIKHINRKHNHYADYLARLAWKQEEYEL